MLSILGTLASDVHDKRHHCAGGSGCHVHWFELSRSDGARLRCSRKENAGWFRVTNGGLGLTGVISSSVKRRRSDETMPHWNAAGMPETQEASRRLAAHQQLPILGKALKEHMRRALASSVIETTMKAA